MSSHIGGKNVMRGLLDPKDVAVGTEYNIENLLLDYKKLMLVCSEFNYWIAYKTLFMHICGGCQFVSDVFAGTHILKTPGAGFMDVWYD